MPIEIAMQRPQPYVKSSSSLSTSGVAAGASSSSSSATSQSTAQISANKRMYEDVYDQSEQSSKLAKTRLIENDQTGGSSLPTDSSSSISSGAAATQSASLKEQFIRSITKKFDETAALSSRPITENIMPLSKELTTEKIASIKAKKKAQQRNQVTSGVDLEDDLLGTAGQMSSSISARTAQDEHNRNALNLDFTNLAAATTTGFMSSIGGDDSDAIMREIMQRECGCRNRFSVLQSPAKQFEKDINAFLQSIKAKEDGGVIDQSLISNSQISSQQQLQSQLNASSQKSRPLGYNRFDQERYGGKDETGGFSIDTKLTYQPNGGTISLTPNPNAPPPPTSSYQSSSQLTQQKTNIMGNSSKPAQPQYESSKLNKYESSSQSHQRKGGVRPIIIIPNTSTSLISMANVIDILQDLKYVSAEEKRRQNQNAPKDTEIIMHRREDGRTQQFKVVDNVNKLVKQDWDRVVAVFAQGQQWQFKGWPFGNTNPPNPVDIFNKVKGFHLKIAGKPMDPNVAKWSVSIIELDEHKRHLDRARLLTFWDELDK